MIVIHEFHRDASLEQNFRAAVHVVHLRTLQYPRYYCQHQMNSCSVLQVLTKLTGMFEIKPVYGQKLITRIGLHLYLRCDVHGKSTQSRVLAFMCQPIVCSSAAILLTHCDPQLHVSVSIQLVV